MVGSCLVWLPYDGKKKQKKQNKTRTLLPLVLNEIYETREVPKSNISLFS